MGLRRRFRRLVRRFRGSDYPERGVLQPARKRIRQYRKYLEVGERVLEIGTGSGVLAELAFEKGAREVTAVDINPAAVAAAAARVPRATVIESDLFEKVEGLFDTIIFAPPWSEGEIKSYFHHAIFDNGVVDRFLEQAPGHLAPLGSLWLQYSDESEKNFRLFGESIERNGWKIEDSWTYRDRAAVTGGRAQILLYRLSHPQAPGSVA